MAYLPELHYCSVCKVYLGPDNGDGICCGCEDEMVECSECGELAIPEEGKCPICREYEADQRAMGWGLA